MKPLTCEMCGSVDLLKRDGVFVCESCGTKYTVEEAKKMMIEGTVEVQGTVKVDTTDELKKLYQAARNAREAGDDSTAIRHYENISARDPDSWEALFYLVILKTNSIKNSEIASAASAVTNSLERVFQLIKENISSEEERKVCVDDVAAQCYETSHWLTSASHNFYKTMTKGNGLMALTGVTGAISSLASTGTELSENAVRCITIANIMYHCGNCVEEYFGMDDEDYKEIAIKSWIATLDFDLEYANAHKTQEHLFNEEMLIKISTKIHKYYPSYEIYDKKKRKEALNTKNAKVLSILSLATCWIPLYGLIVSICTIAISKDFEDETYKNRAKIGLLINIVVTLIFLLYIFG